MDKKLLIIEDSELWAKILERDAAAVRGFTVCGCVRDVYKAVAVIEREKPELIILDAALPGMDGVKFLRTLIPQYPVPVVVCTAYRSFAQKALAAGAADFLLKPNDFAKEQERFKEALAKAMLNAVNLRSVTCEGKPYALKKRSEGNHIANGGLILIGGSAGSTEALPKVLSGFTPDMPPTAVALHMPKGYTELYAKRLNETLKINVVEAKNGMRLKKGMAAIAQGAKHLRVAEDGGGYFLNVSEGERVSGHCPSVDALFGSAAELRADKMIAVLLTGMGSDGAKGLLALRKAGAFTIGQNEESSLVYGMPKAAHDIGAVCRQCAPEEMARVIKSRLTEEAV